METELIPPQPAPVSLLPVFPEMESRPLPGGKAPPTSPLFRSAESFLSANSGGPIWGSSMLSKESEELVRHIDALKESIRLNWAELETKHLSREDRAGIRLHIDWCETELRNLRDRLDRVK